MRISLQRFYGWCRNTNFNICFVCNRTIELNGTLSVYHSAGDFSVYLPSGPYWSLLSSSSAGEVSVQGQVSVDVLLPLDGCLHLCRPHRNLMGAPGCIESCELHKMNWEYNWGQACRQSSSSTLEAALHMHSGHSSQCLKDYKPMLKYRCLLT